MLLLFDIDGTLLLKAHQEHRDALHEALRAVYGIADPAGARVHAPGRTDSELVRLIALQCGLSAERIDEGMADARQATCAAYARRAPDDLAHAVAPGMREVLSELAGRDGVRLALVTGNYEPIARLKLARAGIGAFFERGQGGFGSDHEDRSELPGIARGRAGSDDGGGWAPYSREQTVVIGDTPRDIACAHADGVRCVAVATGPFAAEELGGADAVARSSSDLLDLLMMVRRAPSLQRYV